MRASTPDRRRWAFFEGLGSGVISPRAMRLQGQQESAGVAWAVSEKPPDEETRPMDRFTADAANGRPVDGVARNPATAPQPSGRQLANRIRPGDLPGRRKPRAELQQAQIWRTGWRLPSGTQQSPGRTGCKTRGRSLFLHLRNHSPRRHLRISEGDSDPTKRPGQFGPRTLVLHRQP